MPVWKRRIISAQLQTGLQSMAQRGKLDAMLGEEPGQMSEAEATMWNQQMQSALASLEGNLPSLSRDLASQLRQMDASKLGKLSPEQLEALRKRRAGGAGHLQGAPATAMRGEKARKASAGAESSAPGRRCSPSSQMPRICRRRRRRRWKARITGTPRSAIGSACRMRSRKWIRAPR